MLRNPPSNLPGTRISSSQTQLNAVSDAAWKSAWPRIAASCIAFFLLLFGLALAALEAAALETGSNVDTTSVNVPASTRRSESYKIGVGIWSGAIVFVAAIFIFIINCSTNAKVWIKASMAVVCSAAIFSATNIGINAKIVNIGVETDAFKSGNSTEYRLAAAQLAAASLSFLTCLAFILLFIFFILLLVPRAKRR